MQSALRSKPWPPSRVGQWAQKIGPHTAQLFERMMEDKLHPEMGYRGCLGVIRLAMKYSNARVEAAAERALLTGAFPRATFPTWGRLPPLRSGWFRLTKPNTSPTIRRPASLRSDGVRLQPGIPFGFLRNERSPSPEPAK